MPKDTDKTAEVVEKIANSKGLGEFGTGIGIGIAGVAFFMMMPLVFFAQKWDGHLHEQKECYEFKEIDKKLFKLNTCTGEIAEVEINNGEKK
ncbi:MAG: hypothetical protein KZQ93_15985 [Candidatus Thiodiazotropha sp. (ex Monitilora ramsayi)]|nr:hypothetical protein [Candidatus Thiodiazotropha sp. (ex Monitilora ramsayi)]